MKEEIRESIALALERISNSENVETPALDRFEVSIPKEEFGDLSTNIAMILASRMETNPRALAEKIVNELANEPYISSVKVAGPGFINITVSPSRWIDYLGDILSQKENYGKTKTGKNEKVMVEFVSANPTGPLHIGHGRGAAVGDALARILSWAGYDVYREYYINDVGLQMENLGRSTIARANELLGRPFTEPAYKGEYIKDIASDFIERYGAEVLDLPDEQIVPMASEFTGTAILASIRKDLDDFRVSFDEWFSEKSLHDADEINKVINIFSGSGDIYEQDGAMWLKTESAGDEKDRVVRRANGITTYLAADIAYHKNKLDRGFSKLIDIWGADHHGYIPRMKASISALGHDPKKLSPILVQMVSLKRGGKTVSMSTRGGVFVTLREIIDEVGVDATRYFFLMRSSDSHLDFDVDLAKKRSDENPVFYIQYAHARCANIFVTAKDRKIETKKFDEIDKALLEGKYELRLIKKLAQFPDVIASCAEGLHPHPITQYLTEVSSFYHSFYHNNRVVTEDIKLSQARLALIESTMIVLKNGLSLLGVSAPDRM
ncbi:Arginyl-tRNA synthetase [hydrothermal vent metagenome]|uniref:arginine--tRNA ligase n=1 Tax=hydrothermal vent metagenome TaxID=652676 RepID=A0A3B1BW30_9ZZZZ